MERRIEEHPILGETQKGQRVIVCSERSRFTERKMRS